MDTVCKEKRSEIMRAVKGKDTKIEIALRRKLSALGVRYRKNVSSLVGKPDLAFITKRVVVFLDSCFWHGCNRHCRLPASNKEYWWSKIQTNQKRDKSVNRKYKLMGWRILRFWEHDLKNSPDKAVAKIIRTLST